jgi:hypothetical protein
MFSNERVMGISPVTRAANFYTSYLSFMKGPNRVVVTHAAEEASENRRRADAQAYGLFLR